jgi:hypothetical protein
LGHHIDLVYQYVSVGMGIIGTDIILLDMSDFEVCTGLGVKFLYLDI